MGVFDELALSGVNEVERRLGTRAALRALVPLLDTLPAGRGRGRALLRAIEYAAELGDDALLERLTARWPSEGHGRDARLVIRRLLVHARAGAAVRLAEAEVERARGGHAEAAARYALGRCLEAAGRTREALAAHEDAGRLAEEQPRLRQSAGARQVRALLALGEPDAAAHRAARLLPLERAPNEERLAVAVAALESPGRYRRVAALDVLELLARGGGPIGRDAMRFAAWHAERAGAALSRIEMDRLDALLGPTEPEARARLATLGEPAGLVARARSVVEGNAAGPRPEGGGREVVGWLGLAACAAIRDSHHAEALEHIRALIVRLESGARVEASGWTAARCALGDAKLAGVGQELASALLERGGEPPPRGYASFAAALDAAGAALLGTQAWRRAAARREAGAREHLARIARWRGWKAAEAGARDEAIARLREARRLAGADPE